MRGWIGLARDAILLRHRVFREDALAAISGAKPAPRLICPENIPQNGACVITVNHYHRAGFFAPWLALAISAAVPTDIHWIMTSELTFPGKWYARLGAMLSHF